MDDTPSTKAYTDRSTDDQQTPDRPGPAAFPDQYAALSLMAGGSIIYDQRDSSGWIQSDTTQDLEQMV